MTNLLKLSKKVWNLGEWGKTAHPVDPYGVHYTFKFKNGYGASVVKFSYSYGYRDDLWELAVIRWIDDKYDLVYDTEITSDVLGYLSDNEVEEALIRISKLKGE